jgi:hypothetical protein
MQAKKLSLLMRENILLGAGHGILQRLHLGAAGLEITEIVGSAIREIDVHKGTPGSIIAQYWGEVDCCAEISLRYPTDGASHVAIPRYVE